MENKKAFNRRHFLSVTALGIAATQFSAVNFLTAEPLIKYSTSKTQSVPEQDRFDNIKRIKTSVLDIGYAEAGPSDGQVVILLHGWPYDIHSFVEVTSILTTHGYFVLVPHLRGHGSTRFLSETTMRNGQQAAIAKDIIEFMDALKIKNAIIGGFDWGARTANIVAALWPERCKALVSVSGYLIGSQQSNRRPLSPKAELSWWYQYYFATERGREGYRANTHDFAKLIWQTASPKWTFDDATFNRSATSLDNPDHVAIVIHNYQWRLGLVQGEKRYDEIENELAAFPGINVPTITLEGDANGAPHPNPEDYVQRFKGKYLHRTLNGGIGHNLPQEAPKAFANAIVEVTGMAKE
jgi:pimeloyl-ACP methyl ester carboxylesterase